MGRRFFGHGELPLVLLALLAERPMHRYELMAELDRLFGPLYRPSPGSVYPAIDALEAEKLIAGKGGPRVYRLTAQGDEALAKRRDALVAIELRTGVRVGRRDSLDAVLERFAARLRGLAGRVDPEELEKHLEVVVGEVESMAVAGGPAGKGAAR